MVCDATHGETRQNLKLFKCGALGHSSPDNEYVNGEIPLIHGAVSQESVACIAPIMRSFKRMCWEICSIQIEDHVEDYYLDGNSASMQVFAELFPDATGHMCL